jgi:hypothetical protein
VTTVSKHVLEMLFKIQPVYKFYLQILRSVHNPEKELSLDEAMIPWRSYLKYKTYSSGKITKCGVLGREWCVKQCKGTVVT